MGTPIHNYYGKNERARGFAVQEALEIYFQIKIEQVQIAPVFAPITPLDDAPSEAPAPIAQVAPVIVPSFYKSSEQVSVPCVVP